MASVQQQLLNFRFQALSKFDYGRRSVYKMEEETKVDSELKLVAIYLCTATPLQAVCSHSLSSQMCAHTHHTTPPMLYPILNSRYVNCKIFLKRSLVRNCLFLTNTFSDHKLGWTEI